MCLKLGFQRVDNPLAESRDGVSGGVWGNNANNLSVIGIAPLWKPGLK